MQFIVFYARMQKCDKLFRIIVAACVTLRIRVCTNQRSEIPPLVSVPCYSIVYLLELNYQSNMRNPIHFVLGVLVVWLPVSVFTSLLNV